MDVSRWKRSIIVGGLTSSAGTFLAKFIELSYVVPYNSVPGAADNLAHHGIASSTYSYPLSTCTAGFSLAIVTLIVKYSTRGDYQISLLIKKLFVSLMACFGFEMMIIAILSPLPLAVLVILDEGDSVKTMQMVLVLISSALFFVPLLSSIRSFYQGFKHTEIYALSRALEQVARVASLLSANAVAVYASHTDRAWALHFGAISTGILAILTIVHLKLYDKKQVRELKGLAKTQEVVGNNDRGEILKELVFIAFLYLTVVISGYSDTIVNTLFLSKELETHGSTDTEIPLISDSINYSILKLMPIPMILTPGSSSAITPHTTTVFTSHDPKLVRENIRDCVDIVLYVELSISFCLFVYAEPLYTALSPLGGPKSLELFVDILSWFSVEAFLNTIGSIFTALLMAVGLHRPNIRNLAIIMMVKFSVAYPLLKYSGRQGVVMSSILTMGIFIILDIYALTSRYRIRWEYTLHKPLIILLAMTALFTVVRGCDLIGLKGYGSGRMLNLLQLTVNRSPAMLVYLGIMYFFSTPQIILHLGLSRLLKCGRGRQANATG